MTLCNCGKCTSKKPNRAYLATCSGHYLGATFVVIAESLEQATQMAQESARVRGLEQHKIDGMRVREIPLEVVHVAYLDDGDY